MKKDVILAFDIGTTNVKCAAVSVEDGELLHQASAPHVLLKPKENYLEIDPNVLFGCVERSVAEVVKNTEDSCRYLGISFSWFNDCLLLADENRKPLTNIIQNDDLRAAGDILEYFVSKNPQEYCKARGLPPVSMFLAPRSEPLKALWFKRNEPEIWAKTRYYFDNQQILFSMLGLEPVNDDSMSFVKRVENVRERRWSKELLDLYEIPEEWCRERIVDATEQFGTLDRIGGVELPYSVPVIPGAHDEICAMLGMGVLPDNPGVISDMMGTSDCVTFMADYTNRDFPETGVLDLRTPFGCYNVYGHGLTVTGGSFNWLIQKFYGGDFNRLGSLFENARFDGSGNLLFVPLFSRGATCVKNLSLSTGADDIFRALAEGLVYELSYNMKENDETMLRETGHRIEKIVCSGGQSRADSFLQLRASVFGLPVQRCATTEAGAVGAAMLAAVSLGVYGSFGEAAAKMVRLGKTFEPDPAQREAYLKKESAYRALHDTVSPPRRHR